MVDASDIYKSSYVNVDLVRNSQNRIAVIIGAGKIETNEWGRQRLTIPVDFEGDQYDWSLNRESWENLSKQWGKETKKWLSKKVHFDVKQAPNGKDMVVARPLDKDYYGITEERVVE